ncbi:putative repeat protein (TIGR01451 family) [Pseudoduganella lurida]|uniref:Putative repeat protein (TIGR01451 family) n=1 Tax=Pseudoduganella lurida TaxID=1036180 RepID=A0A562RL00_9BURK|nr:DUF11 domain-containing protein [Pseudoduganella lurida]TWI69725.1 putative repeat protein (TIGR01451 family) [Pseudoduganella lurida]
MMTTLFRRTVLQSLRHSLALFLLACGLFASLGAHAACTTTGACISAGPRLASVDTTKSALLNPLLGGLLGTNLNLTAADWNTLATGEVNLLGFLTKLQAQTNVSSPSQALTANATLAQITAALGLQAQAQASTSLSGVLAALGSQLGGAGATVRVGDLLKLTADVGSLANTTINSLDMLTGLVQLYNRRNVLTTPTPVGISGGALGMLGVINSLQLYTQVIEPAVYICGPTGTQFHTAAVRVKLKLDLVTLAPATGVLTTLLGNTQIAIGQLDVYVEIARGEGTLTAVDAVAKAVTLQALPGVADVYLGKISDDVFFNRSRTINPATDLDYGKIGTIAAAGIGLLDLEIRSWARGQAPSAASVTMSGTFPQTKTVSTSAAFVTNLVNGLVSNTSLRIPTLNLGLVTDTVLGLVKGIVTGALSPVLGQVLTGVVDPLLQLLGVGLGQVIVTVNGIGQACDDFKLVKAADKANAQPGNTIAYTITYQNAGTTTITNLKIVDATPAYTVFGTSACGTLAPGLTNCSVSAKPAAGATGGVEWTFTGTLMPGASGTVTLNVLVQ